MAAHWSIACPGAQSSQWYSTDFGARVHTAEISVSVSPTRGAFTSPLICGFMTAENCSGAAGAGAALSSATVTRTSPSCIRRMAPSVRGRRGDSPTIGAARPKNTSNPVPYPAQARCQLRFVRGQRQKGCLRQRAGTDDHALVPALAPRDHAAPVVRVDVQPHPTVRDRTRFPRPRQRSTTDDRVGDARAIVARVVDGYCGAPGDRPAAATHGPPTEGTPAREPDVIEVRNQAAGVGSVERRRRRARGFRGDPDDLRDRRRRLAR